MKIPNSSTSPVPKRRRSFLNMVRPGRLVTVRGRRPPSTRPAVRRAGEPRAADTLACAFLRVLNGDGNRVSRSYGGTPAASGEKGEGEDSSDRPRDVPLCHGLSFPEDPLVRAHLVGDTRRSQGRFIGSDEIVRNDWSCQSCRRD
jgi:hypothetical protein